MLAVLLSGAATARADPCPPEEQRLPDTWYVTDDTTHQQLTSTQIASALPELHSYEVALIPGTATTRAVEIEDLSLATPAGVPAAREGPVLFMAPQSPGPLTIAATWTEHDGLTADCTRSASLALEIGALAEQPDVRIARRSYRDRPLVSFTFNVARGPFADADPIEVLARVGAAALAPKGPPAALLAIPLRPPGLGEESPPSGLLSHRSTTRAGVHFEASSAFEASNNDALPVPSGGTSARVTVVFAPSAGGRFFAAGSLGHRGVEVELVQDGHLLGSLSTGIACASHRLGGASCRLIGYSSHPARAGQGG